MVSVLRLSRVEPRVRVVLVGGHEVARLGLHSLLETSCWFKVVADVGTVAEAVLAADVHRPALLVVAGAPPDHADIDDWQELRARVTEARIVILGEHIEVAPAMATRVGAIGCLSRQLGAQRLCRALRELAAQGPSVTGHAPPLFQPREDGPARDVLTLTAQERRVLHLVARGKTNKEIGIALGLSAKTVKNYLSNAFDKLNVSRRAQAAVLFARRYVGSGSRTQRSV